MSYYPQNISSLHNVVQTEQEIRYAIDEETQTIAQTQTEPQSENESSQLEQSYLGRIGKFCEPVMKPLGLDWKATVAIITGVAAKEIVVSTLGILYHNEDEATLSKSISDSGDFTLRSALAFMVFILIYFPCVAALAAINSEAGKIWALFSIVYNTVLAWILAFVVYITAGFFV